MIRLCTALLLAVALSAQAQKSFSSLEEQMSGEDFKKTGLEKLSDSELAALNTWLQTRSLLPQQSKAPASAVAPIAPQPTASQEDPRGFENQRRDTKAINARLVGEFTGWTGKTRFELDNGQIWQQARGGSYRSSKQMQPEVELEPKALGTWAMTVEGVGRAVRVKRIK